MDINILTPLQPTVRVLYWFLSEVSCTPDILIPANEKEVGEGIKASGVPREDIFLVTKLNNTDHGNPREALDYSLKALDTPYLDLCSFIQGLSCGLLTCVDVFITCRVDALARSDDKRLEGGQI